MRLPSFVTSSILFAAVAALAVGCSSSSGNDGGSTGTQPDASSPHDTGTVSIIVLPPHDAGTKADARDASMAGNADAAPEAAADVQAPPTDAELNTYPSFAPPVPQIVNFNSGPVLAKPIYVPIFFTGDPEEAEAETFLAALGPSLYWQSLTEYGVGPGTLAPSIVLDETMPATITDTQLEVWLGNRIGTDPRFGALPNTSLYDAGPFDAGAVDAGAPYTDADSPLAVQPANVIYTVFLPSGTTITEQGGDTSCHSFGGYHTSFTYAPNGKNVVYAAIPRCASFDNFHGINALTATVSHELAEAATDPYPNANPAYFRPDLNHFFWSVAFGGGEVGDMCAQVPGGFYNPAEASLSKYVVQRLWSNEAAAAGNDPCIPDVSVDLEPYYFNSVPSLTQLTADDQGFNFATLGISSPAGVPTNLAINLFSNKPTAGQSWQVQVFDLDEYFYGTTADLTFTPAMQYGMNGDTVNFTMTNANNDGKIDRPFLVVSTLGATQTWWVGVATN